MKTKNNVQQTILKSVAVVFSLVLISITVNAQHFWKSIYENNSFKDIALAMVEVNAEESIESSDANTISYYVEESEEALEVENWMMNEETFGTFISLEEEIENPLEVEEWMTNDSYFENATYMQIEETENELEIEDWMLNENLFKVSGEVEQALKVENWMISDETWKV